MKRRKTTQRTFAKALSQAQVMKASELVEILGSRTAIKRKVENGELHYVGSGFYSSESVDPLTAGLMVAGKYYAKAVVSNLTALLFHKLSDEPVAAIDVDIDKGSTLRNRILRVHRVSPESLCGILEIKVNKVQVRIYSAERALCDAYKLDPGGAIFFKALKRYIKQYDVNADLVRSYDEKVKTRVLPHLKQELADE